MKKFDYEADAARLVSLLGQGKQNAVRRSELLEMFGGTDRQMRKVIAYARLMGTAINNDQDGCGYYLPDELGDLLRQYYQTEARGRKILAQLKAIKSKIVKLDSRLSGQLTLEDYERELGA